LKKHNEKIALQNASLEAQKIVKEKLLIVEENKIEANKETSQRFIKALVPISNVIGYKMYEP